MYNKKTGGVQKKESTTAKAGRDRAEISFVLNRGYGGAIGKNRKSSNFVREGVENRGRKFFQKNSKKFFDRFRPKNSAIR